MYTIRWLTLIGILLFAHADPALGSGRKSIVGDWMFPPSPVPCRDLRPEDCVPEVLEFRADGTEELLVKQARKLVEPLGDDEGGTTPEDARYVISKNTLRISTRRGSSYAVRFRVRGNSLFLSSDGHRTVLTRMPKDNRAVRHKPNAAPHFVDMTLAGIRLGAGREDIPFDPQSGYYLHTDGEMASGPIDTEIFLTPDAKQPGVNDDAPVDAAEDPGLPQVVRTRHLLLQTGRGVAIGDTPLQMRQKLGAIPTHQEYHVTTGARVCLYEATIPVRWVLPARERRDYHRTGSWYYQAVYIFHHERLWSIRILAAKDRQQVQLW